MSKWDADAILEERSVWPDGNRICQVDRTPSQCRSCLSRYGENIMAQVVKQVCSFLRWL